MALYNNPFDFNFENLNQIATIFDIDAAGIENYLLELQTVCFKVNDFKWKNITQPFLRLFAAKYATIFASTYLCEAAFSTMGRIKSKSRNRITDFNLEAVLRCALAKNGPDLKSLPRNINCQVSH